MYWKELNLHLNTISGKYGKRERVVPLVSLFCLSTDHSLEYADVQKFWFLLTEQKNA